MCGIIGYVGERSAGPILLEGLQRLEYRGYDSAGIAVLEGEEIHVAKAAGKLQVLLDQLRGHEPEGTVGIGHTRWATHGRVTDVNAHPHCDCGRETVVIHNGIVENFRELRAELAASGHSLVSETDTEVMPHLVEEALRQGLPLREAVAAMARRLAGSQAILVVSRREPDRVIGVRLGNAGGIAIGYGEGEMFLASDLPALLPHTRKVLFLHPGETCVVTREGAAISDLAGVEVARGPQVVPYDPMAAARGPYRHFMLKEMMEQPQAVLDTVRGHAQLDPPAVELDDLRLTPEQLERVERVLLIGMGSSMHAAMIGRYYVEHIARLPAEVDNSAEFRYRAPLIDERTLVLSVCQSGETVDTLEAMAEANALRAPQLTICNMLGAQTTRVAQGTLYTRAGLEICVAATKTFIAQLAGLFLLATWLGHRRGVVDSAGLAELLLALSRLPHALGRALELQPQVERVAQRYAGYRDFLFLGRGLHYPVALEGALKLKEIAYIHAEGYAAGEMKHGPIALVDGSMPVVALAPHDALYGKMLSNIEQVRAREAPVIAVGSEGDESLARHADVSLLVPEVHPLLQPAVTTVPLQLLAYAIAVRRGCDVDQPRNLAKTVTVE